MTTSFVQRERSITEMQCELIGERPEVSDAAAYAYAAYLVDKAWEIVRDAQVQSKSRKA